MLHTDLHPLLPEPAIDGPANGEFTGETEEGDPGECLRCQPSASQPFSQRVTRGHHQHHRLLLPRDRNQLGPRAGVRQQADIDLIQPQLFVHAVGMLILKSQHGVGELFLKPADEPLHLQQPDRINRGDPDSSDHPGMYPADPIFDGAIIGQQLPAPFVINLPGRCHIKWPLSTVDEGHPQLGLEQGNRLAGGRL